MSVHVNLSAHAAELKDAYKSVLDKDNAINWIILGYAKGTNDLKVVGQGEDGLEELAEEFEDDKVLFAFTRVVDPNSNLPKYVFISWCGEGAPVQRKGLLPSHLNDVQKFLSGYHVQINARDSEDVAPDHVMKKIEEGSGAKYSYHEQINNRTTKPPTSSNNSAPPPLPQYKRSVQNPPPAEKKTPPPPAFKPPAASQSLQDRFLRQVEQSDRDKDDREKQEQFEKDFLARSQNKSHSSSMPRSISQRAQEAKDREEQELKERMERARASRLQNPDQQRQAEEAARKDEQRRQAEEQEEARKAEERRQAEIDAQNAENERQQLEDQRRKEEMAREQERFKAEKLKQEQEEAEAERVQREQLEKEQKKHEFERMETERRRQEEASARAQEKLEKERLEREEAQLVKEKQEREEREREELLATQAKEAEQLRYAEQEPDNTANQTGTDSQAELTAIALFDYIAADETELSLKEGEMVVNVVQIDEGWWQGTNESGVNGIFPANYVEVVDNPPAAPEVQESAPAPAAETSTAFAIALYDYQATEEGELNFAAADKITNIDFLSDDWWQGSNSLGESGLFPANYVELQQ